jgi:membrane-associated phospholipid phosphatase
MPWPRPALRFAAAGLAVVLAFSSAAATQPASSNDKKKCRCSDPETRARLVRCYPNLLVHDAGRVLTAPARWKGKQWGLFATGLVGVSALLAADPSLRTLVQRNPGGFGDRVAKTFEPLGMQGSFVVIGGFFVGGLAAHDEKAKGVALDALAASIIAGGIITPVLKEIAGRSRPNAGLGAYDFHPFHGGPSFPSGHATQAFAVASVIATEYPRPWVKLACYLPASLVLYARMRHDAHWASDVTAGALIGYGVGSGIARMNLPLRMGHAHAQLTPELARGGTGLALTVRF